MNIRCISFVKRRPCFATMNFFTSFFEADKHLRVLETYQQNTGCSEFLFAVEAGMKPTWGNYRSVWLQNQYRIKAMKIN